MPAPVLDKVMQLAARHHAAGRLREAAAIYRGVLQREPLNAIALHALGVMAQQTSRPDAAEKLLLRAIAADPTMAAAYDDLASLRLLQGKTEEALAGYRHALDVDPSYALAHAHLGAAMAALGHVEQAVAAYQRAVEVGLLNRRRRGVGIDIGPIRLTADGNVQAMPPVAHVEDISDLSSAADLSELELPPGDPDAAGPDVQTPATQLPPPTSPAQVHAIEEDTPPRMTYAGTAVVPRFSQAGVEVLPVVEPQVDAWRLPEESPRIDMPTSADAGAPWDAGLEAETRWFLDSLPAASDEGPAWNEPATEDLFFDRPSAELDWAAISTAVNTFPEPAADAPPTVTSTVATELHADHAAPPIVEPEAGDPRLAPWARVRPAGGRGAVPSPRPVKPLGGASPAGPSIVVRPMAPHSVSSIVAGGSAALAGGSAVNWPTMHAPEPATRPAQPPATSPRADSAPVTRPAAPTAPPIPLASPDVEEPVDDASSPPADLATSQQQNDAPEAEPVPVSSPPTAKRRPLPSVAVHAEDPLVTTRALAKQLRRAKRETAVAAARQAVELSKEGTAHLRLQRVDEAITVLEQLVALHPTSAKAYKDLGAAYLRADRLDDAAAALVKALEARPKFADAFASLGDVYHLQGKVDEAIACYRRALALKPSAAKTHSNLLLTLNYHRKLDARAIYLEHVRWAELHARPLQAGIPPHANDPSPDRQLRIGYVSPDFRRHSVNYFVEPFLAAHDRDAFHLTCYSDVLQPDDETDRIAGMVDHWRDIRGLSDEAVAAQVREDQIDILLDLAGHTGSNRLGVFARKPAPVAVTYLGYPNTTGLSTIDYRITDAAADPPGQTEQFHSEQLLRLPNFLCYQPPANAPEPSPPPILATGFVTFGCFNILAKVTPEAMSLWAKLMTVLPNSRLVMKDRLGTFTSPSRRRYVQDVFKYHRISADRLELLPAEPDFVDHLRSYAKVDVMLDPYPYNGTTTTCESLWMGVPVVTLAGTRHAARAGVSVLTAAGLTEFIGATLEAYARTAVVLARDPERLTVLRRTLRQRLTQAPLLDARRFTSALERGYRLVWQRWGRLRQAGAPFTTGTLTLSDE